MPHIFSACGGVCAPSVQKIEYGFAILGVLRVQLRRLLFGKGYNAVLAVRMLRIAVLKIAKHGKAAVFIRVGKVMRFKPPKRRSHVPFARYKHRHAHYRCGMIAYAFFKRKPWYAPRRA